MTLAIRKVLVIGLVVSVFLLANVLFIAHWLNEVGMIDWAVSIRREFLTGTAITIILALLILLVPASKIASSSSAWVRRCPVCDGALARQAKYCGECGSKV